MVYKWKVSVPPIDAQTAGEELERIYTKHGELKPSAVVEESKPAEAPLHPCFEWDDSKAAIKYRESQAACLVRNITIVREDTAEPQPVRAFVHVQQSYHPLQVVLKSQSATEELLKSALRELQWFQQKYSSLSALQPVFDGIALVTHP